MVTFSGMTNLSVRLGRRELGHFWRRNSSFWFDLGVITILPKLWVISACEFVSTLILFVSTLILLVALFSLKISVFASILVVLALIFPELTSNELLRERTLAYSLGRTSAAELFKKLWIFGKKNLVLGLGAFFSLWAEEEVLTKTIYISKNILGFTLSIQHFVSGMTKISLEIWLKLKWLCRELMFGHFGWCMFDISFWEFQHLRRNRFLFKFGFYIVILWFQIIVLVDFLRNWFRFEFLFFLWQFIL